MMGEDVIVILISIFNVQSSTAYTGWANNASSNLDDVSSFELTCYAALRFTPSY